MISQLQADYGLLFSFSRSITILKVARFTLIPG